MRLPNLDLTLLAAHCLLAAADDGARRGALSLRAPPCPERIDDAPALANATRAGLIDRGDALSFRLVGAAPPGRVRRTARFPVASHRLSRSATPVTPARARRAALADWSRAWKTLPVCQRAELAQAIASARRARVGIDAHLASRDAEHRARTVRWLTHPVAAADATNGPAHTHADADDARRGQDADTVALYRCLENNPTLTLRDAVATAQGLADARAGHAASAPDAVDMRYQVDRLADFFSLPALCHPPRTALDLLRQVHAVLGTRFPEYRAALLDEHAVAVAARLRQRCTEAPPDVPSRLSVTATHGDFLGEVSAELTDQARAAHLIPWETLPPADGRPWFDGIAVRDASGKTVRDLVEDLLRLRASLVHRLRLPSHTTPSAISAAISPAISSANPRAAPEDPAANPHLVAARGGLPQDARPSLEHWVRKRLADLAESTRFPFGTPPQSIDTILLRLSGMHGVERTPGDDFATVLRDFTRLCAAWHARPGYWVSPTLAAALHLAHASGTHAALRGPDRAGREDRLIDVFHERLQAYRPASAGEANAPAQCLPPSAAPGCVDGANRAGPPAYASPAATPTASAPRDFAHAFLETAEPWLALPRWPMRVGRTLVRGEPREVLSLLPFVVPAYDIEEGVRLGNASRAMRGAFAFGADIVMTWLGGRIDASLAVPEALPALGRDERAALAMLHHGVATLGETRPRYLPLTERVAVERRHGIVTLPDADAAIPLPHRPLASRAREGEIVPIGLADMPDAWLIHLSRERRVIPVGVAGSTVRQLDWEGNVVGMLDEQRLGDVREPLFAEARARASSQPRRSAPPASPASSTDGRTVNAVEQWLASRARALPSRPAPNLAEAEATLRPLLDFNAGNPDERAMFEEWRTAYRHSETFRLVSRSGAVRADGRRLGLSVEAGAVPHYAPERHVITVPRANDIAEIEYLGWRGLTRFDARDVWIHEFIHAMTGLSDPEPALAALHRGPVVYLTDRILYEMNRRSPERVVYALPRTVNGATALGHAQRMLDRVVRENILLDEQLMPRLTLRPETPVLGVPVRERATVKAAIEIEARVRASLSRQEARPPFIDRLLDAIRLDALDERSAPGPHLHLARDFVLHAQAIYESSAWARGFLDAWLRRDTTKKWTLHAASRAPLERHAAPCRVHAERHRIELSFADSFAYLGPLGLRRYPMRRRVAFLLSELASPSRARAGIDADVERGAAVYAENRLLGLGAASDERRVAARVWRRQRVAPFSFPTVNPTLARRVADDEDRFLASVCTSMPEEDRACF